VARRRCDVVTGLQSKVVFASPSHVHSVAAKPTASAVTSIFMACPLLAFWSLAIDSIVECAVAFNTAVITLTLLGLHKIPPN
jgi:hypothetical protein